MKKYIALVLIAFLFTYLMQAQTHEWNGNGGDSDWFNATNWDVGSIPNSASDVLIPTGFEVQISQANANVNTIDLEEDSTLILENGLTISSQFLIQAGGTLHFKEGTLNGGVVNNNGNIIITLLEQKYLDGITIENNNLIQFINTGFIRFTNSSVINNYEDAVIDIIGNSGLVEEGGLPVLNNYGLLKKSFDGDSSAFTYMIIEVNNHGVIDIEESETFLFLSPLSILNNFETGIIQGSGIFDITGTFFNEGTISPGGNDIGTLAFINTFNLDGGTISIDALSIDQYDKINVTGGANMSGNIEIEVLDILLEEEELEIITGSFNFVNCDFPETINYFDDFQEYFYDFDVSCDDNILRLTVTGMVVLELTDVGIDLNININPNPITQNANILLPSEVLDSPNPKIDIYNLEGKKVRTLNVNSVTTIFERKDLASGLYFIKLVSNENLLATKKIILR